MISVILCGGAGSRLWPVSRETHPKPFIRLADGQSLIQKAFNRAALLPQTREIMTITNSCLYFKINEEYETFPCKHRVSYILEPFGRNTAPAITAAALVAAQNYGQDMPMLILAADHLISDLDSFALAVEKAVDLSGQGFITTFGIKPTRPDTGFGYVEADSYKVSKFVEKPDQDTAEKYFNSGSFFWNSGMFCFEVGTYLDEMERHAPDMLFVVKKTLEASTFCEDGNVLQLDADSFSVVPSISVDYALMEKTDLAALVPCEIGWSDIGSWSALSALNEPDVNGNHVTTDTELIMEDTFNCDIHGDKRLVATLGLKDILIVDTPDALLVSSKDHCQDVKNIYNHLKSNGHEAYRHHRTVYRPWGSYTLLEEGPRFKMKKLEIKPGAAISLQMHHHRSEHWIVVSGMAEVTCDEKVFLVDTNESTYIKAGHKHRVANRGLINLVIIEVQSGDYLGEDDIIRFDDEYGRVI